MDPTGLNLHCVAFYCLSSSALHADRHIMVDGTGNAGDASDRTVFYMLNMEHAQAESNMHVANATNVDIFGLKVEGSLPVLWVSDSRNVTLFGMGGGADAFPDRSYYPDSACSASLRLFCPGHSRDHPFHVVAVARVRCGAVGVEPGLGWR